MIVSSVLGRLNSLHIALSFSILQERNKLFLTRAVVLELVHAVKFRSSIPDTNLQSVLQVHNCALERFSIYIQNK